MADPLAGARARSGGATGWIGAVLLTGIALGLLNGSLAYAVARATGMGGIGLPDAVVWLAGVLGLLALMAAVLLWRHEILALPARRRPR